MPDNWSALLPMNGTLKSALKWFMIAFAAGGLWMKVQGEVGTLRQVVEVKLESCEQRMERIEKQLDRLAELISSR